MPILATEVSRAFVPPCTRADIVRATALGPDEPLGGTGTLATNSAANEAMVVPPQNPRPGAAATRPLPVRRAASITIGLATIRNGGEDTAPGRGPHGGGTAQVHVHSGNRCGRSAWRRYDGLGMPSA